MTVPIGRTWPRESSRFCGTRRRPIDDVVGLAGLPSYLAEETWDLLGNPGPVMVAGVGVVITALHLTLEARNCGGSAAAAGLTGGVR